MSIDNLRAALSDVAVQARGYVFHAAFQPETFEQAPQRIHDGAELCDLDVIALHHRGDLFLTPDGEHGRIMLNSLLSLRRIAPTVGNKLSLDATEAPQTTRRRLGFLGTFRQSIAILCWNTCHAAMLPLSASLGEGGSRHDTGKCRCASQAAASHRPE